MIKSSLTSPISPLAAPLSVAPSPQLAKSGDVEIDATFGETMQSFLGMNSGEVSEEDLFAAIVNERLQQENPDAAQQYQTAVNEYRVSMARPDGRYSMEDIGKAALQSVVDAGLVDLTTAEKIHGQAFAAAQLDENSDMLYDSTGGPNDPTRAVADLHDALGRVQVAISQIDSGESDPAELPLDHPSNTTGQAPVVSQPGEDYPVEPGEDDGSEIPGDYIDPVPSEAPPTGPQKTGDVGGFFWRPQSKYDGKLVVMIPASFNGFIQSVEIHSAVPPTEENKVEEGAYAGMMDGNREMYRFTKEGGQYGDNLYLVVKNNDGTTAHWSIKKGAKETI